EATGSAATFLDPHDVRAWARAIRTVFDDAATAAAMRQRALARFASVDRDAPAREMLALLERVALGTGA
ncbi:MAG: glycosyltransferase family 1 protein, partial [Candidatus Eremiobacteraeota bacterium]|nr:glycosyltransferase family 1 protein [Candidatus Eremiobacteraeota bacterium]